MSDLKSGKYLNNEVRVESISGTRNVVRVKGRVRCHVDNSGARTREIVCRKPGRDENLALPGLLLSKPVEMVDGTPLDHYRKLIPALVLDMIKIKLTITMAVQGI